MTIESQILQKLFDSVTNSVNFVPSWQSKSNANAKVSIDIHNTDYINVEANNYDYISEGAFYDISVSCEFKMLQNKVQYFEQLDYMYSLQYELSYLLSNTDFGTLTFTQDEQTYNLKSISLIKNNVIYSTQPMTDGAFVIQYKLKGFTL